MCKVLLVFMILLLFPWSSSDLPCVSICVVLYVDELLLSLLLPMLVVVVVAVAVVLVLVLVAAVVLV